MMNLIKKTKQSTVMGLLFGSFLSGCGEDAGLQLRSIAPGAQKRSNIQPVRRQLSIGKRHACVVVQDRLFCWGQNDHGQLGIINSPGMQSGFVSIRETATGPALKVTQVAVGLDHTCAAAISATSGQEKVYCWGSNSVAQVSGNGTSSRDISLIEGLGVQGVSALPVGTGTLRAFDGVSCWLADRETQCWGKFNPQVDPERETQVPQVQAVTALKMRTTDGGPLQNVKSVLFRNQDIRNAGSNGSQCVGVAENVEARVYCSGHGPQGELGYGKFFNRQYDGGVVAKDKFPKINNTELAELTLRTSEASFLSAPGRTRLAAALKFGNATSVSPLMDSLTSPPSDYASLLYKPESLAVSVVHPVSLPSTRNLGFPKSHTFTLESQPDNRLHFLSHLKPFIQLVDYQAPFKLTFSPRLVMNAGGTNQKECHLSKDSEASWGYRSFLEAFFESQRQSTTLGGLDSLTGNLGYSCLVNNERQLYCAGQGLFPLNNPSEVGDLTQDLSEVPQNKYSVELRNLLGMEALSLSLTRTALGCELLSKKTLGTIDHFKIAELQAMEANTSALAYKGFSDYLSKMITSMASFQWVRYPTPTQVSSVYAGEGVMCVMTGGSYQCLGQNHARALVDNMDLRKNDFTKPHWLGDIENREALLDFGAGGKILCALSGKPNQPNLECRGDFTDFGHTGSSFQKSL